MKLIFLDIDGVLNTHESMVAHGCLRNILAKKHPETNFSSITRDKYGHLFDENAVTYLHALVEHTDAKIVISSTWRYSGLKVMKKMWKDRQLPGTVIGITPCGQYRVTDAYEQYHTTERGYEIKQFMMDLERGTVPETHCILHGEGIPIENYVIFDDDTDMLSEQMNHFVQCGNNGISYRQYKYALSILGCSEVL